MRQPEVDLNILDAVLAQQGLTPLMGEQGRGYDLRGVRRQEAGTWLLGVLESFEQREGGPALRFRLMKPNLLVLSR